MAIDDERRGELVYAGRSKMMPLDRSIVPDAPMDDRAAVRPTLARTLRGLVQYGHLLRNLVVKDLKLKYRGSVLGFVWSLANPLLMIAVYTSRSRYILRDPHSRASSST